MVVNFEWSLSPSLVSAMIETVVQRDSIEPRGELCLTLKSAQPLINSQKNFLREVFGLLTLPGHPERKRYYASTISLVKDGEQPPFSSCDSRNDQLVMQFISFYENSFCCFGQHVYI